MTEDKERSVLLPLVCDNALEGHKGETAVDLAVSKMGFIFRGQTSADYGVDATIEVTLTTDAGKRVATGRLIAVQVKQGDSVVRRTRYGYTLYCSRSHANYWLRHSLPVIVVYSHPKTERLFWTHITETSLRRTPKGFAIDFDDTSELTLASEELRKLAESGESAPTDQRSTLLIPFDEGLGITISDEELGIACLEIAKSKNVSEIPSIEVEVVGQAELIASIDAIRDMVAPTVDQRREALIFETILDRYEHKASQIKRAIGWLLKDPKLSRFIGLDDRKLAVAVRKLAGYYTHSHSNEPGTTPLVAWPAVGRYEPSVVFDVSAAQMDELYARSTMMKAIIRMGDAGGVLAFEVGEEVFVTRFLPALVRYLMNYGDKMKIPDEDVLEVIGVEPDVWLLGLH
ncbi:DUF4365 domain-containing protein [Sinorhizobium meliloti]|uniref:DUF4365 domain-containing protein n=1 Tax=Rhizobium meliloti TaxID=382 RepID=UPI000FD96FCD|nr:DUF4365 domain-containing protein [Sinorhizobium meliloti]RVK29520.1 DUF4365 domain-containing protein [Sinorhizobium meliloti]